MSLSSLQLDAFTSVARLKSFSQAAKKMHLTQSALSQRVLNLEQELGSTLFIRESSGIRLTDLGNRLLRYCQSREFLETEFVSHLQAEQNSVLNASQGLHGIVRLAGFSTVTRAFLLPVMAQLLKTHPGLQLDLLSAEIRDLPDLITSGRVDFVLLPQALEKQGVENHALGFEENVMIKGSGKKVPGDLFLDHDPEDNTTFDFFKHQGKKPPQFRRVFLDEIYSIIEGVRLGMGRAIVPLHLVRGQKGIEVVPGFKPLRVPIFLTYYSQAFYTLLQKTVKEQLLQQIPLLLRH